MRWTLIIVLAFASVATAQELPSGTPQPPGVDISARDGDRIVVDDDSHIQIVRRRQATVRTIYSQKERLLIVLVDFSKPGAFPDGQVDWAYTFYQVEGAWPLGPRWEALTAMLQYEGARSRPSGLSFETPQGLLQVVPGRPELAEPDPRARIVLSHRGSSSGSRRGLSFAEVETDELRAFARRKASSATVSTLMPLAPNTAPPESGDAATNYSYFSPPVNVRTPPPAGQEIAANDGDRVIVDDDARVHIIRRRQATIRAIFSRERRVLIVLADYAKSGEFPDGNVDTAFNFYELEGD